MYSVGEDDERADSRSPLMLGRASGFKEGILNASKGVICTKAKPWGRTCVENPKFRKGTQVHFARIRTVVCGSAILRDRATSMIWATTYGPSRTRGKVVICEKWRCAIYAAWIIRSELSGAINMFRAAWYSFNTRGAPMCMRMWIDCVGCNAWRIQLIYLGHEHVPIRWNRKIHWRWRRKIHLQEHLLMPRFNDSTVNNIVSIMKNLNFIGTFRQYSLSELNIKCWAWVSRCG